VHPNEQGEIEPSDFDAVLDEQVGLVQVAHVCYKNGHLWDVAAVGERAHAVGALFVVDDYQSCGSREFNVKKSGVDVLAAGTVKFLLGSPGVAFLYVDERHLDRLHPTMTGWFGQEHPTDFQVDAHVEARGATRFQSGTPAIPSSYDSLVGVEQIAAVGLGKIGSWIDSLTKLLIERLLREGYTPATPLDPAKRGAQVAIRSHDMERLVAELANRDVIVSCRDGNIRTAFHYYNTPEDIERLMDALKDVDELLVRR